MRYFQLALVCFICVATTYGQTGTRVYSGVVVEITKAKKPKRISTKVEITNAFPGGDSAWIRSLENRLNQSIPFKNGAKTGTYIVSVKFLVERDGSLADVVCIDDPGFGMCKKVVEVIRKPQKWSPGKVRSYSTSPVRLYTDTIKYLSAYTLTLKRGQKGCCRKLTLPGGCGTTHASPTTGKLEYPFIFPNLMPG